MTHTSTSPIAIFSLISMLCWMGIHLLDCMMGQLTLLNHGGRWKEFNSWLMTSVVYESVRSLSCQHNYPEHETCRLRLKVFGNKTDLGSFFQWPAAWIAISLLCHCAASFGSLWVWNAEHICCWKWHSQSLSDHKNCWRRINHTSVCIQILANACYLQSENRSIWILELWTGEKDLQRQE